MTAGSFRKSRLATIVISITACLAVGYIVLNPDEILQSSLSGLGIWWRIVFPALLPFYMLIEMMNALGIIHFIAKLLEPVMRRLFTLPGIAGWCVTIGWAAGSPAGASHIADLRRSGQITREQGERLLAIAHTASPVLIFIVIAAGFLGDAWLGIPLVIAHWLGVLIVAVATRKRPKRSKNQVLMDGAMHQAKQSDNGLFQSAIVAMEEARRKDHRPFGKLLGDSVFDSIQKLLIVGGYMIFFSVLVKIIVLSGIGSGLIQASASLFTLLGLPQTLSTMLFNGVFEQHLGSYAVLGSDLHEAFWPAAVPHDGALQADVWSLAALSAVLGWSGLCLHAQVKAAVSSSDLRYYPFLFARLLHAVAAALGMLLCYPLLAKLRQWLQHSRFGESVFAWSDGESTTVSMQPDLISVLKVDAVLLCVSAGALCVLIMISAALHRTRR